MLVSTYDIFTFFDTQVMDQARSPLYSRLFSILCVFSSIVQCAKLNFTDICQNCTKEMVLIKPHTDVKYFTLPTSDEPVVAWMDIQKGTYPNTSYIQSSLQVGEPITIFIYLKDPSNLYDIMVTDCWAYDLQDFEKSKNKLHLTQEQSKKKRKLIDQWNKRESPRGSLLKSFMFADLSSFKFPESDQVHVKCDVQLCFKSCEKLIKKIT